MYTPKIFQNTDTASIHEFIRKNSFGILVSQLEGKILASHIPMELSEDGRKLHGHLAKGNPQWRQFEKSKDVLAIFSGPHAYISSSWYNHENVPTWNYIAAHAYGSITLIEGEELMQSLGQLVDKYERASEKPVSMKKMSANYLQSQIRGLVGFRIDIAHIEASYKLSQNRDEVNHTAIIHQLEKRKDGHDQEIADAMRKYPQTNQPNQV